MADEEENQVNRMINQADQAVQTARTGLGLVGSLFTAALWVGIAALVWNFMPASWRENITNLIPEEWRNNITAFISEATGGALFSGAALEVAANTPVEEVREQLTADDGLNLPDEVAQAIAPNAAQWRSFVGIMRSNNATISAPLNAGVINDIFKDPANRGMATRLVASFTAMRSGGDPANIPTQLKTALEAFLADGNSANFNAIIADDASRHLLFDALRNISPEGAIPTNDELDTLRSVLEISNDDIRTLASAAADGSSIEEALGVLMASPAITAKLADPAIAEQVAPIIGRYMGDDAAPVTAEDIQARATTANLINETYGNNAPRIMEAMSNPAQAISVMYEVDAAATNRLFSNTTNLEQFAALIPAGAGADNPIITLIRSPQGRTALSSLVTELAASNAQAPKQLLEIVTALETQPTEAQAALVAFLGEDEANIAAMRNFATAIAPINAPANSELAALKTALTQVTADDFNPAVAGAVLAMPENTRDAIDQLRTTMDERGMNAALTLMMRDETLRADLLTQDVNEAGAAIGQPNLNGVGDAIAALAADDEGNIMLDYLAYNNERAGGYANVSLLYNLVRNMDAATGGTGAAEARADQLNADVISIMMTMAQGEDIAVNGQRISVPGTNRTITADQFSSVFANDQVRDAFAIFFENSASLPSNSPLHGIMEALNRSFWDDKDGDRQVDSGDGWIWSSNGDGEGLVAILQDSDSVVQLLENINTPAYEGIGQGMVEFFGTEGPIKASRWALDILTESLEELGDITAPRVGGRTAQERFDVTHP